MKTLTELNPLTEAKEYTYTTYVLKLDGKLSDKQHHDTNGEMSNYMNSVEKKHANIIVIRDADKNWIWYTHDGKNYVKAKNGRGTDYKKINPSVDESNKEPMKKPLSQIQKENTELMDAVLTPAQRKAKGRQMKRLAPKMAMARKRAMKKKASPEKLKGKAHKKARNFFRDKILKASGKNFADLAPAEKMRIEKMLDKKKAAIEKLAKKMLGKVRKAESERMAARSSSKSDK